MTHSLSEPSRSFLADTRLFTVGAIQAQASIVPAAGGIYGWWFDASFLEARRTGSLERAGRWLLYVGIAPSGPPKLDRKSRTLRDRLKNHCRGPIATSTLRRTLAAILGFDIEVAPSGKRMMSPANEARLTAWMDEHARVMWSTATEPWVIEHELLELGPRLPLNIAGSSDPFRFELKALRAGLPGYSVGSNRFVAEASDIQMLGKHKSTVDHLTDQEKADNVEHERILNSLFRDDQQ